MCCPGSEAQALLESLGRGSMEAGTDIGERPRVEGTLASLLPLAMDISGIEIMFIFQH